MLRPKKKITKKEMKKDPVLEKIAQIDEFVRQRQKIVFYVTIGLVVVVVLSVLLIKSKQKADVEAMGELGLAEQSLAREDYDDAILRLENIVTKYKRTRGAGMATLLLGRSYMAKNDWENARLNFQKYIDDYEDDDLLTAAAYNGLGIWAEQQNELKRAAEYFSKGGKIAPYKFQRHEYLLNAARCFIKGNELKKADALVQQVLKDEPESKFKSEAEALAAQITALASN